MKLTEFGKQVRKIRLDHDHLLKDMAEKVGVSPAFLSSIETGKKPVPVDFVDRLARVYKLDQPGVLQLRAYAATTRNEFAIHLPPNISNKHREAAAVLARRFPGLSEERVGRILNVIEQEEDNQHMGDKDDNPR